MANTARAGVSAGTRFGVDVMSPLMPSGFAGTGVPFVQWTFDAGGNPPLQDAAPFAFEGVGDRTAHTAHGVTSTPVALDGVDEARGTSPSLDWHEHVHALPRTEIQFGDIITQEQADYEVYSAYRRREVVLTSVTNNISPGIELPNLPSAPAPLDPQTSFLDPTSTDNSGGTGLGTLVKLKIVATQDGLPQFHGTVDFAFDAGDEVSIEASGSRIVLMPFEYEAPCREVLAWLTEIIEAIDGNEQRIAHRENPRQLFEVTYLLDSNDRQRMQAILMDWTDNLFGFPLWHEKLKLTASHTAGTTTYSVAGASAVDLRVGGLAVVFTDANTFDVIQIAALTDTLITAEDPSVNSYATRTAIMPLRIARIIDGQVTGGRSPVNLERFAVRFEVSDNTTGALTGSAAAYSTYNGRTLLDDCNVVDGAGEMPEEFARRVHRVDNDTGKVTVTSDWDRGQHSMQKGFVLRSRSQVLSFRRMLLAHRGRQKALYLPTAADDLTVAATLNSGSATMDVTRLEYVRFVRNRGPKRIFKITFTDGTSLVRVVQSSTLLSSTVERLTLDTTWPSTKTAAQVSRVQFYQLMRFDSDEITIDYPRIGLAESRIPVTLVGDDDNPTT